MRLGSRLFLLVAGCSLIPSLFVLAAGWLQLRHQLRLWTLPSIESALDSSIEGQRQALDRLQRHLEHGGMEVAARALEACALPVSAQEGRDTLLAGLSRELDVDLLQIYRMENGAFVRSGSSQFGDAGGPDAAALLRVPASSPAGPQRPATLRISSSQGDFLAVPVYLWSPGATDQAELAGALVLGDHLGTGHHGRFAQISSTLLFYRRLGEVGAMLKTGYGLLAGIGLLACLAVSLFLAARVAREISRPVNALVRQMEDFSARDVITAGDRTGRSPPAAPWDVLSGSAPGALDLHGSTDRRPGARATWPAGGAPAPESPVDPGSTGEQRNGQGDGESGIPEIRTLSRAFSRMAAQLRSYEDHLREGERIRGSQETARFVAHEIRNALTPVRAALGILQRSMSADTPDPNRSRQALELIQEEAERMTMLAGTFSEYARFPERRPAAVDLVEVIEKQARELIPSRVQFHSRHPRPEAPGGGGAVTTTPGGREKRAALVQVDRDEIDRVVRNLIQNAVQATSGPGTITSTVEIDSASLTLLWTLEDTGAGMDEATLARAFQLGYTTRPGGSGLGLALVRSALNHYGGSIRLESRPGEGTLCRVALPLAVKPVSPPDAGDVTARPHGSPGEPQRRDVNDVTARSAGSPGKPLRRDVNGEARSTETMGRPGVEGPTPEGPVPGGRIPGGRIPEGPVPGGTIPGGPTR